MKLCGDCRHLERNELGLPASNNPRCLNPRLTKVFPDYITGEQRADAPSIRVARTFGGCGADAILWEAVPEDAVLPIPPGPV